MVSRRNFITTLGLSPLVLSASAANVQIGPATPAFVPRKAYVNAPVHIMQSCPSFCWAASIAMIFAKHNHPIQQEKIVVEMFGSLVCAPAPTTALITSALSKSWVDDNGLPFTSQVTAAYDPTGGVVGLDNPMVINELSNDRPLLICNPHHAMVLAVIDYLDTPMGPNVQAVGVLDPHPGSPNFHYISPAEYTPVHMGGQLLFLGRVNVF